MKNTYYVRYGSFSNVYGLLAVTDEIDQSMLTAANDAHRRFGAPEWKRITRKECRRLRNAERRRRKEDPSHSGYADADVMKAKYKLSGCYNAVADRYSESVVEV